MTQGERVRAIRTALNLTTEKFGSKLGIQRSAVSKIENGRCSLTDANIKSICREFNIDYIWMTTGEGDMFIDFDDEFTEKIDRIMAGEDEFHKKLIKWCATAFNDEDLRMLEKLINSFVNEFSEKKADRNIRQERQKTDRFYLPAPSVV